METTVRRFIPPCAACPGPVASLLVGVGQSRCGSGEPESITAELRLHPWRPSISAGIGFDLRSSFGFAVGVGHKPNPVSPVRGVEGTSRYNNRPAGVAERFQVSQHTVEAQSDVSSNILKEAMPGP